MVNEAGPTSDSYTVVLNTQPTGNVTITVTSDSQTTVSPTTLTFTSANWNIQQTVTVTAVGRFRGGRVACVRHYPLVGQYGPEL